MITYAPISRVYVVELSGYTEIEFITTIPKPMSQLQAEVYNRQDPQHHLSIKACVEQGTHEHYLRNVTGIINTQEEYDNLVEVKYRS